MSKRIDLTIRQLVLAYREEMCRTGLGYCNVEDLSLRLGRLRVDEPEKIPTKLAEILNRNIDRGDSFRASDASLALDEIKFAMNWLADPESHESWCRNAYENEIKNFVGKYGAIEKWIIRIYKYVTPGYRWRGSDVRSYYEYLSDLKNTIEVFEDLFRFTREWGVSSHDISRAVEAGHISVWKFIQEHQEEIEKDGFQVREPCQDCTEMHGRWGLWNADPS